MRPGKEAIAVDIERLQRIIKLLKDEGLSEITISEGETRITVRRDAAPVEAARPVPPAPANGESPVGDDGRFTLTAPLVGTFYRRPSPEDEPFVRPGDLVEPGTTVGIIEAMKVMNEIKAEQPGRLVRAMVDDGDPVEYSQILFIFERP
jgi:biotin carboxyl carrier protein